MRKKVFYSTSIAFLVLQAFCYGMVKFFQKGYHVFDFKIDAMIPFIPEFIYIYNLFYPFVFVCLFLIFRADEKEYKRTLIAGIGSVIICYIWYLIYPTQMMRPDVSQINGFTGYMIRKTYELDEPSLNCCPSIHCIFAFMVMEAFIFCNRIKMSRKILVSFGSLLIVFSTFFVKQHYVLDAVTALAVFSFCYFITGKVFRK